METDKEPEGDEASSSWRPLSTRLGGTPIDETWQEGIPLWVEPAVRDWLDYQLSETSTRDRLFARFHFISKPGWWALSPVPNLSAADLPDWIDAALNINRDENEILAKIRAERLEIILREGRSKWKVSETYGSLERRQDETVTAAAHQASEAAKSYGRSAAAERLRNAWSRVYGLHSDPSKAYGEAILAVEAVAIPAITPNQAGATLGHVYGQLRNQRNLYELAIAGASGTAALY